MLEFIVGFIFGTIIGISIYHILKHNRKKFEVKKTMENIREEFHGYFEEYESNQHIICPTCGNLMNLDKKVIVIENGDVINLIYTCPYCSTQKWI